VITVAEESDGKSRLSIIKFYVWDGCTNKEWIKINNVYLVNPKYIEEFKKKNRLS